MIIRARSTEDNRTISIHIEGDKISQITPFQERSGLKDRSDLYIAPGFFDPQVNGFAGIDFNEKSLLPEHVRLAAEALSHTGVTTFFPTLITASFEKLCRQLRVLRESIENEPFVSRVCRGIHLEGPYISSAEGPSGIHPSQFIREPNWDEFERFQEASGGRIRLITLAPERQEGLDFIEKAVANGVIVAIGHTAASEEILEAAYQAGARLSTHLGNGIGDKFPRYRNPFQKQLSMDGLMATLIADGYHLPDYVLKNIVRAKGPERIMLITDAISAAAQPPGMYRLADLEVEVGEDGRTHLTGTGSLAGSTLSIPKAISNVIKFAGINLGAAVKAASENGRKLFPELIGTIAPGQPANLVLFRFKEEIKIEKIVLTGEEIQPPQR